MRRSLKALAGVALLCIGGYVIWKVAYPTYSYRFRLTLEAEKNGDLKTGSSVYQVTTVQYPRWVTLGANHSQTTLVGDAVVLDLDSEHQVVSLLKRAQYFTTAFDLVDVPPQAFFGYVRTPTRDSHVEWSRRLSQMTGRRQLEDRLIPMLVTFMIRNDPKSVRRVFPDNFPAVFGPHVVFRGAFIELTSDPVTSGIEKELPWLPSKFGSPGYINQMVLPDPDHLEQSLHVSDFTTGLRK
jgi:hypothetical protein